MAQVYISSHAYHNGFEVDVDLKYAKYLDHPSWGLKLLVLWQIQVCSRWFADIELVLFPIRF